MDTKTECVEPEETERLLALPDGFTLSTQSTSSTPPLSLKLEPNVFH